MKKCSRCEADLPDNARFCLNCGASQTRDSGPTVQAELPGSGAIAQDHSVAAGKGGVAVRENVQGHVVIAQEGATVVIGEAPVEMTAVDRDSALGRYLRHVISRNRYLQLQGIRSGGRLVHIELDRIYIALRATRERVIEAEEMWLAEHAALAPGEKHRLRERPPTTTETVTVNVNEAMGTHPRLVVLGDPGSGKTTLLRYLALLYARDLAEGTGLVKSELGLDESDHLPILLPLRQVGTFLKGRPDDGTEGHALLLDFVFRSLENERIELPHDFFDEFLTRGRTVILLDGLDEVADPDLRRRVSRLVESFTRAYPDCRAVITSRIVGYAGSARLGERYVTTTVQDFLMADVERFLVNWHRLVAIGQMGPGESAEAYAAEQTQQLMAAIRANERICDLAINPLMLTVIAMVHRDRVKLPDRRAELYAEAVDVLLGKWEEAKGLQEVLILEDKPFDTGDKRLMLQSIALRMHEKEQKEVADAELRKWSGELFHDMVGNEREAERAVERFLQVIQERTGLLVARGEGVYAFSHLTFQEYLTALAVAARDDYIAYTLTRVPEPWWREVILLEAGYLSLQSKERTTHLIRAIADLKQESEPYHNLVLAAECLRDVGSNRVQSDLDVEVQERLRQELDVNRPVWLRWLGGRGSQSWIERRSVVIETLARVGVGYWTQPYGEPEWVQIPTGPFVMGSDRARDPGAPRSELPQHEVELPTYSISVVPITNSQYHLFVMHTEQRAPQDWDESRPPKGKMSHPAVNVSWRDALAYCEWMSQVTGEPVRLPSEAEWEKAARGPSASSGARRKFPWGDSFDPTRCNSSELGMGDTTPVGMFPNGASSYGCLDMAGNVWEWTSSLYQKYPYNSEDGRENLDEPGPRGLRGGAFNFSERLVRCTRRYRDDPDYCSPNVGFRVVVGPRVASP